MVDISILPMVYKPTYNWGAPPCMFHILSILGAEPWRHGGDWGCPALPSFSWGVIMHGLRLATLEWYRQWQHLLKLVLRWSILSNSWISGNTTNQRYQSIWLVYVGLLEFWYRISKPLPPLQCPKTFQDHPQLQPVAMWPSPSSGLLGPSHTGHQLLGPLNPMLRCMLPHSKPGLC